ncbi:MAG TPA: 3-dehydroquinate synthase family protein [Thermoanaerobaculia bacterium]|jgi:3-dehydroquinate synthase|nr:3-dehydroquinate synthase family protein [Thermoanaerobaculia bacterium]
MSSIHFTTQRCTATEYCITDAWAAVFSEWSARTEAARDCARLVLLSDETVWTHYESDIRAGLHCIDRTLLPLIIPPGEDAKDFQRLSAMAGHLEKHGVHRRDLLVCFGGGVCCDLGGFLAQIYMRGLNYILLPSSLMAQIDAAIGGKVGANFGLRKNLLGGFHHPLLVVIDSVFLTSLPQFHFRTALAEAVKLGIICDEELLTEVLGRQSKPLLDRQTEAVRQLVERCVRTKLELLRGDPYENELNRVLNLGHGVAHAIERLPIMPGGLQPCHGEAVAIGLAATARYSYRAGFCDERRSRQLIEILKGLGLPVSADCVDPEMLLGQLRRIREHRGGLFRLVVPTFEQGVRIVPEADLDLLAACLQELPEVDS